MKFGLQRSHLVWTRPHSKQILQWCESVKFLSRNKGMRAGKNLDLRLSQYIHCAGSVVLGDNCRLY